ncbi:hypothetical protein [Microbacterium rhizomatis]|uniref:Uncharacterized protein n=1 Tax=Microbacterium rhizomatis TaxID=1631477 RepID=A0A5J5J498_9MICO|nr:hypothetical protein [Microbacterium rhizomatis]KAA9110279.1 hypothetical protein F6B43_00835 [Microbacterium rhizomatis]
MPASEDDDRELMDLRRKVYGPDEEGAVTDADLRRLRELEDAERSDAADRPTLQPSPATADPPEPGPGGDPEAGEPPASTHPHPGQPVGGLSRVGWLAVAAGAAATLALGVWAGSAWGGSAWAGASAPRTLPEFDTVQTDEDMVPARFLVGDQRVDPATVRFIAVIDGHFIAVARPADYDGVCILGFGSGRGAGSPDSVTCSDSASPSGSDGPIALTIDEGLEIAIGETNTEGDRVRLSESVTAYRR